jgi:hypothetical protein
MAAAFHILICLGCEASLRVRVGDLPEKCWLCCEACGWRIAIEGEWTKADRKLLHALRIAAE